MLARGQTWRISIEDWPDRTNFDGSRSRDVLRRISGGPTIHIIKIVSCCLVEHVMMVISELYHQRYHQFDCVRDAETKPHRYPPG